MNQRIFAAVFLVLLATSTAALELTVTPTSVFLPSGETETLDVTVTNTRNESVELESFTRSDTATDVITSTPGLPLTIPAEDSVSFTIDVTSAVSGTYPITFEAVDNTSTSALRTVSIQVPTETGLSIAALEAGSTSQRRDRTTSGTFAIENDQNLEQTGITITNTVPARYGFNLTSVPSTISAFGDAVVSYELFVPNNQDSGRERIGDLVYTSNEQTRTVGVFLTVQSGLEFEEIEFETTNERSRRLQDGDRIDIDFQPSDDVRVRVFVANQLDIDIEDVRVEMTIERIDDRRDIRERSSRFDIRDGRDEVFEFDFTIPRDADEDTYRVIFVADGVDEDGVFHEVTARLDLRVQRERDSLSITRMDVTPMSVCAGDSVSFDMLIANTGTRNQDRARVVAQIMNVNTGEEQLFSVDAAGRRNDEYRTTFNLAVPSSTTPGTYTARGLAYYRESILSDTSTVTITVRDCDDTPSQPPTQPGQPGDGVVIIDPITPPPQPPSTPSEAPVRGDVYFWLLVALNVLVVILVVTFVVRLLVR